MKNQNKKSMRVRTKLLLLSAIQAVALLVVSALGLIATNVVDSERSIRYDIYGIGQYELSEVFSEVKNVKIHIRNAALLYTETSDKDKRAQEIADVKTAKQATLDNMVIFEEDLDVYEKDVVDTYNQCKDLLLTYFETLDSIVSYVESGDVEAAKKEFRGDGVAVANQAEDVQIQLVELLREDADIQGTEVSNVVKSMTVLILGVCFVIIIVSALACLQIIKSITIPIRHLGAASRQLAQGDVDIKLEKLCNDDLGELMDDFDMMASTIRQQAEIASEVAQGDMTIQVEEKGKKDVLGHALKKLVEDSDRNLSNVKESSVQVTVGSDQVATASQALAQGATEQASALQQVTASVNEIAEHTKDNATQANQADELMHKVKDMAISGNEQMKAMIAAMEDINESSETISKIIKTIDDIAFQTNILALNAAVEAARAGVHGKGFAVVAEEVRNLAAKSASAASETAEMIEDSIHKVGNGTQLAESTAKALDEIAAGIDKGAALVAAIAASSNDQATAVSQVDQAINQVSQVVQTNSATSEQCAAASEELSNQAANLRNLMAYYKLTMGKAGGSAGRELIHGESQTPEEYSDNEQIISLNDEFGKY